MDAPPLSFVRGDRRRNRVLSVDDGQLRRGRDVHRQLGLQLNGTPVTGLPRRRKRSGEDEPVAPRG
jgi:hypothetical protein